MAAGGQSDNEAEMRVHGQEAGGMFEKVRPLLVCKDLGSIWIIRASCPEEMRKSRVCHESR